MSKETPEQLVARLKAHYEPQASKLFLSPTPMITAALALAHLAGRNEALKECQLIIKEATSGPTNR